LNSFSKRSTTEANWWDQILKMKRRPLKIIFWGATGQAKVLRECIKYYNYELIAIFDNNIDAESPFSDVPIFYKKNGFKGWLSKQNLEQELLYCLVAIGGHYGRDRYVIQQYLKGQGLKPILAMHPRAFLADSAVLGNGTQVLANASVCVDVRMGEACIVNTSASVDHDCAIGDGVHIGPGAHLSGEIRIGNFSMVGTGAVILPRVSIGENVIVGAGSVVTRDVSDNFVVCGNPARILRKNLTVDGPVWE
jgi:sugar O-acyltransferase (sialic acid O-acetyltransferase NeuD family)